MTHWEEEEEQDNGEGMQIMTKIREERKERDNSNNKPSL